MGLALYGLTRHRKPVKRARLAAWTWVGVVACSGAEKQDIDVTQPFFDPRSVPSGTGATELGDAAAATSTDVASPISTDATVRASADVTDAAANDAAVEAGSGAATTTSQHDAGSLEHPDSGAFSSPLPPLVEAVCRDQPVQLAYATSSECAKLGFRCATGHVAFFDECGCGCSVPDFGESEGVNATHEDTEGRIAGCGGVVGQLALFVEPVREVNLTADAVIVRTESSWWSIDKRTAVLTAFPLDEPPEFDRVDLGVAPTETERSRLAAVTESEQWGGVVVDGDLYASSNLGRLWVVPRSPDEPARMLEQHGSYDDDDYNPPIQVDADAVYWQAGVDFVERTTDGDPLALYRSCRI